MSDSGSPHAPAAPKPEESSEHLNIKVTDSNNEVFFKIKRTTALKKLMDAFCERQGKSVSSVRFLFDGQRVNPTDNPEGVSHDFTMVIKMSSYAVFFCDSERVFTTSNSQEDSRVLF
jgi:hypothetical protein